MCGFSAWIFFRRRHPGVTPAGKKVGMEKPQFHSVRNTSTLRLQNGQRTVLGAHKIPGDKGLMEIFLLRVTGSKLP